MPPYPQPHTREGIGLALYLNNGELWGDLEHQGRWSKGVCEVGGRGGDDHRKRWVKR